MPSVASINGMQVKDFLQALTDEGQLRVEKIGSGNWYWSFLNEEKKTREVTIEGLKAEKAKLDTSLNELKRKIIEVKSDQKDGREAGERTQLLEEHLKLKVEVDLLRKELASYSDSDPVELKRKKEEVGRLRLAASKWTDNIYSIEGYMRSELAVGLEVMNSIREEYYGDEYVVGEGLREL